MTSSFGGDVTFKGVTIKKKVAQGKDRACMGVGCPNHCRDCVTVFYENVLNPQIETEKLEWKVESKVGSLDYVHHQAGGGDKQVIINRELAEYYCLLDLLLQMSVLVKFYNNGSWARETGWGEAGKASSRLLTERNTRNHAKRLCFHCPYPTRQTKFRIHLSVGHLL